MSSVFESGIRVRGWKGYTALILLWQLTASACFYSVYAVTPFVREEFGVSATLVGVMMTALTLGYTVFLLPIGSFIDEYGEDRALVGGLVGLGLGAVGVTVAPTYLVLLASVFVVGAFYATAMPGTNKAVFNAVPDERLNTSMGIKQVGVTAGSGISSVLVPWFGATRFGWKVAFLLAAGVAAATSIVFWASYDAGGRGSDGGRDGIRARLAEPSYLLLIAAGFALGAGLFTTVGYTILYVDEAVGASVVVAGVTLAAAQVAGSAGRLAFGWLADRLSAPLTVSTLRILCLQAAASVVLFLAVPFAGSALTGLVLFSLLGFFILGFTGVYYSCIGSIVPSEEMGSATAGAQIALNCGALIAPPTFGFLVDVTGYDAGWTMLAAMAFLGFVFLVVLLRRT
ncbi:MFS transporter [Natrinema salifodinae]|uniref:Predicted arabinose efflux permease, MFS family n=1 Tax=Natrinema salifodinae TaxID=1202768 RepID=A0A1I0LWF0_9EURY|nr:MFS transporter [Natrinema salifodinae]SEV79662.1 Predicted arabinose efflux permease, MFS family [Natrinema salifodinae]